MDYNARMASAGHSSTNLESTARQTEQQPDGIVLSKGLTSQVILEILGIILAGRSLQEVLTCVVRVVEAQRENEGMLCSVWLLDQDRVHMRAIAAPTLPESYIAALDGFAVGPEGGSCGAAVNRREPVFVSDVLTDPTLEKVRDVIVAHGIRACWSAPIMSHQGEILGTFAFYFRYVRVPKPSDMQLIDSASRIAAIAIERRRAEQALAVQSTRLQLLLQLANQITSNLELRELLRSISANVRKVMKADAAGVAFFDEVSGKSRSYAVDFPDAKGFVKEEIVLTPGLAFKRAWESSKPEIVNANDPEELGEIYGSVVAEGLNSHCLIPLVSRGRTVGILVVARKLEGSFTHEDVDFLSEASGQIAVAIENSLAYGEIVELKEKLAQEKLYLEQEIRSDMDFEQIVGNSPALKRVLQLVETVAPSDSTVVLLGETGTGKELIARAIHDRSRRKHRTFVKVNCAAIPTGLLESELFGHEKGAFTGAVTQKIGRLELADQGTLFLDEVGDIPMEVQPKLLRALQEREFERLGSTRTRSVSVRLIAATNRDLEKMIAAREFRSDLYYRLNVFPIRIPPLRERREDIPLLVSYFVERFAKQMQKKINSIPEAVMKALKAWEWPGNIRELENFTERAVILTRGRSLEVPLAELPKVAVSASKGAEADNGDIARIVKETIKALHCNDSVADERTKKRRDEIRRALTETNGRVGGADGAAALLGINRTTLLARMKKLGIDARQYA
jgi:formate hydrogenlyase transcriptional activator